MLEVDPVWLTVQVMTALFPEQVDMLLNPSNWSAAPASSTPDEPAPQSVTVELTAAMLEHGYLDIPMSAKGLFPSEGFGNKARATRGSGRVQVRSAPGQYRHSHEEHEDACAAQALHRLVQDELAAKSGDRIRIDKTGERSYTLTHVPV